MFRSSGYNFAKRGDCCCVWTVEVEIRVDKGSEDGEGSEAMGIWWGLSDGIAESEALRCPQTGSLGGPEDGELPWESVALEKTGDRKARDRARAVGDARAEFESF
jgi:hypothetical protein